MRNNVTMRKQRNYSRMLQCCSIYIIVHNNKLIKIARQTQKVKQSTHDYIIKAMEK